MKLDKTRNNRCRRDKLIGCSGIGAVSVFIVLGGFLAASCLGLKGHDREPDTDTNEQPSADCSGVSCWEPPQNSCADDGAVEVHAPSGYCSGGECFYATGNVPCDGSLCDDGVCVETPCQGVTCVDPPEPSCEDVDRTIYAPSGYCVGGECKYASKTSTCEDLCEVGACVDSPCAEVFCRKPEASYCEDESNLRVFDPEGRCAVVEGSSQCFYDSRIVPCEHRCRDGRCQDDPCAGVICDTPPARYCDGAELVVHEPYGVCNEEGFCTYTEQRHPCVEPCVDAHCGEDEACTWVVCDEPPASHCLDDSVLRVYGREGLCKEGFCSYVPSEKQCPGGCEQGRCKGDPCLWKICDRPPASYCNGDVLVDFEKKGTCNGGSCSYPKKETTCLDGCDNGECLTGGEIDTDADTDTGGPIELTWVAIPGGEYQMGSTTGDPDETPVHGVTVPGFEMTQSAVTVGQYAECVTAGACSEPSIQDTACNWDEVGYEDHPVNCVSWDQAVTFCTWAVGRLPSESEWEYAAKSGGQSIEHPWGDAEATCDRAVMDDDTHDYGCDTDRTWSVCSKTAGNTDQGLCDMAGNVWEWVEDHYHSSYNEAPADGSAWIDDPSGSDRVLRGGSFGNDAYDLRAAYRFYDAPSVQDVFIGFRCAR